MAEWYTVGTEEADERLVAAWPDAPVENLELLEMILDTARQQVIAYAPAPAEDDDPEDPPTRYVYAQLQQTINLWNASSVSSDGDVGTDGYTFTPRPLDKTIRTVIRPVSGGPDVY